MDNTLLYYFVVAAEELNFTHAAKRLFVTQQTVSKQMAKLESASGAKLFKRSTTNISLTPAGERMLLYARNILADERSLHKELMDINNDMRQTISIGVTHMRSYIYMPPILAEFFHQYPLTTFNLIEGYSYEIENLARQRKVDFTVSPINAPLTTYKYEKFCTETYVLVIPDNLFSKISPENKYLIENKYPIQLEFIKDIPFLLLHYETRIGRIITNYCTDHNMNLHVSIESGDINVLLNMFQKGLGVLVCPLPAFLSIENNLNYTKTKYYVYPIDDIVPDLDIYIGYYAGRKLTRIEKDFISLVKSYSTNLQMKIQRKLDLYSHQY